MKNLVLGESLEALIDHRGKTPKKLGADFTLNGVPVASAILVDDGVLNLSDARHVSEDTFRKWMPIPARKGDVLLTSEAPLGRVARVPSDDALVLGQRLYGLRGKSGILDTGYLYYALQTDRVQADLLGRSTGTTVFGIRQSALRHICIPAPTFSEQQAIAEVLGALDEKIASNASLANVSAVLAKALFEQAIRDDSINSTLSEISILLARGITPSYSEDDDTITVLNQRCIRDQRVEMGPSRRTLPGRVRYEKVLQPKDVLVNSTGQGTLGRVARWTQPGRVTVDSHVSITRFDPKIVNPTCAGFALLLAQPLIEQMGEGSTGQTELSRTELGKLRLRLPSSARQTSLGHQLDDLTAMGDAQWAQNGILASLRDVLLPKLMSGDLRVRDAEKAVERVL